MHVYPLDCAFGSSRLGMVIVSRVRKPGPTPRRACAAAAIWASVAAVQRSSQADEPVAVMIRWDAPSNCPAAADVESRLGQLLGPEASRAPARQPLAADGTVVAVNGRYQLRLNVRRAGHAIGGTRVFDSDTCAGLAGAAAVTLALLARDQGSLASGGSEDAGAAAPTSMPPAASLSTAPAATEERTPTAPPSPVVKATSHEGGSLADAGGRKRDWYADLELPLVVDSGVLPSWAYGLGLGAGVRGHHVQIVLAGLLWLPQTADPAGTPYSIRYARYTGELSACYGWSLGPFEAGPCMLARLEDVSARGTGPDILTSTGQRAWMTVGIAANARWSLGAWMALYVRPGVAFATTRPPFSIAGIGPLYQVPIAAVAFNIGWEWIL